uniref:IS110 family transposase n=1 Tax=Actinacidiphila soli TaxID=2487275 RepID=UPI001F0C0953|nr:IS110 family transposase [Actinacidiphila soli]
MVLANILRTDAAPHRKLPADSELAQAVAVLARGEQDAVWDRTQPATKLTSHLREYFPGFLAAVGIRREGVCHPIARTLLAACPTPEQAARLTRPLLRSLLKKAGRKNTICPCRERQVLARAVTTPPCGRRSPPPPCRPGVGTTTRRAITHIRRSAA